MSVIHEVILFCDGSTPDGKDCEARIQDEGMRTPKEARDFASRYGWIRAGRKDYCDSHPTFE